jgi:hypothetical protein
MRRASAGRKEQQPFRLLETCPRREAGFSRGPFGSSHTPSEPYDSVIG